MRYYLFTVQHNKVADAENRSVPRAFDSRHAAVAAYHAQIAADMSNATLDWSINMLINSAMGVEMSEKWTAEEPAAEPAEMEAVE